MWIHRRSEEPSPTSVVCYWKKPMLSQIGTSVKFVKAIEVGKLAKTPQGNIPATQGFLEEVLNMTKKHPNYSCPLHKHLIEDTSLKRFSLHQLMMRFIGGNAPLTADNFISFCNENITSNDIIQISKSSMLQSEDSLWYELRYGRITASKLYDVSRCKKEHGSLVNQILGVNKKFQTLAMQRGIKLEKAVLKELERILRIKVKSCGLVIVEGYGIVGASPDGLTDDSVIEVKCPASLDSLPRYIDVNGQITKKFLAQINLQMLAKKVQKGIFCVALPDFETSRKIEIINVDYDAQLTESLLEQTIYFWKTNVFPLLLQTCTRN